MISKALAIAAFLLLPLSVLMWHKSHNAPEQYRYDVTVYKSLRIYLKNGICGLRLLSMPTRTASRSEFRAPLTYNATPNGRGLMLASARSGPNRITWIVFPFWLATGALTLTGTMPIVRGPLRRRWRRQHGTCEECGYNLRGNRSGRCSECGTRFSRQRVPSLRGKSGRRMY